MLQIIQVVKKKKLMMSIINKILDLLFNKNYKAEIMSNEAKILLSNKENLDAVMSAIHEIEESKHKTKKITLDKKDYTIEMLNPL
jgi:hypothetical protein